MQTSTDGKPDTECRRVLAHGRVQGVGFRESCMRHARSQGVTGWVRNRADGTVEAVLQGRPAVLDAMCDWLRHHVPGARVDSLEVEILRRPCSRLDSFERRPSV